MTTFGEQTRNAAYFSEMRRLTGKRKVVFDFIRSCREHGATLEEVADGTGFSVQCICGRKSELECPVVDKVKRYDLGVIQSIEITRPGRSGIQHHVFVAKEFVSGGRQDIAGDAKGLEGCTQSNIEVERAGRTNDPGFAEQRGHARPSKPLRCNVQLHPEDTIPQVVATPEAHSITKQLAALKQATKPEQLGLF